LREVLGDREAAVARELTKLHEECVTGSLDELARRYADLQPKGEIVIVVAPPAVAAPASAEDLDSALRSAMETESPSRAAALVAEQLGLKRKQVYERALQLSR
jgi:16S rRNA (cytidine1402-2'-O)-methyltransferase